MNFNSVNDLFNYVKRDRYLVNDAVCTEDTEEDGAHSPDGTKIKENGKWNYVPVSERSGSKAKEIERGDEKPLDIKATKKDIESLQTIPVKKNAYSNDELENIYKNLPNGENKKNGLKVRFVNSMFGKIIRHNSPYIRHIIPHLKEIFDNSTDLADSNYKVVTPKADGKVHADHFNYEGYHNYLGKVKIDGNDLYVRFSLAEEKSKDPNFIKNKFQSVFVSDIDLYTEKALECRTHSDSNRETQSSQGFDSILAQALREVYKNQTKDGAFEFIYLERL